MISSEDLSFYHINDSDFYNEDVWYYDDYININEHTETNDSHKISEIITEIKLEMSDSSDE